MMEPTCWIRDVGTWYVHMRLRERPAIEPTRTPNALVHVSVDMCIMQDSIGKCPILPLKRMFTHTENERPSLPLCTCSVHRVNLRPTPRNNWPALDQEDLPELTGPDAQTVDLCCCTVAPSSPCKPDNRGQTPN